MEHLSFQASIESALGYDRLEHYRQSLRVVSHGHSNGAVLPTVLVVEPDPLDFLAATIAAIEVQAPVILGNPQWSVTEWQGLAAMHLLNPDHGDQIWGQSPPVAFTPDFPPKSPLPTGAILIATGGSGGLLRFAHHTWDTLRAAVKGLQRSNLLPPRPLSACCLLPLYHVSGFMQFVRSFLTQGDLILSSSGEILRLFEDLDFEDLDVDDLKVDDRERLEPTTRTPAQNIPRTRGAELLQAIAWETYALSLVPTQLHRFVTQLPPAGLDWLRRFGLIFVGGAALRDPLRQRARALQLPLAPTYGMTETAGMVATLSPQAFLEGNDSVGRLLPHCQVQFVPPEEMSSSDPEQEADQQPQNTPSGRIIIRSESLALGYYPPDRSGENGALRTNDRGWIGTDRFLYIAGRLDRVMITGGEKVHPEQIEAVLLGTGLLTDVAILGAPHLEWGEQVVAFCVGVQDWEALKAIVLERLSPPQRPKVWIPLQTLPRNDRGKILRAELLALIPQ